MTLTNRELATLILLIALSLAVVRNSPGILSDGANCDTFARADRRTYTVTHC